MDFTYRLLNAGYFSEYGENATRLAEETSWETLMAYYKEMVDYETNIKGMEYQLS